MKKYTITAKIIALKVIVTNTKTGEEKEFDRAIDAATYIGIRDKNMAKLSKNNSTTRTGWKVKYVKYVEGE